MRDLGVALKAPQRLGARRQGNPDERQASGDEPGTEAEQNDAMDERRQQAPAAEQREH